LFASVQFHFGSDFSYLVTGATNNGGEDGTGCVISGETGLAHAGAIVNDKSSCVLVTHLEMEFSKIWLRKDKEKVRTVSAQIDDCSE